jgi:glyoxylase-like metal-dependent hydrolase (beta-lactamase superfamily II)
LHAAIRRHKNGYIVICETTRQAVIIDPGDEITELLAAGKQDRARVIAILLTHAHVDHVTGVAHAKSVTNAPIWIHRDDLFLYNGVVEQGRMLGLHVSPQPTVDQFYQPGRCLEFGDYAVEVSHTPGHSPGGVCLAIGRADSKDREVFVGDTLFAGSIGRTDLPGGDVETLLVNPDVMFRFRTHLVHSGHGPEPRLARRRSNPFLRVDSDDSNDGDDRSRERGFARAVVSFKEILASGRVPRTCRHRRYLSSPVVTRRYQSLPVVTSSLTLPVGTCRHLSRLTDPRP